MKLAAIDIGSNAIRLQIVQVYDETELISFKSVEYLRFPLRLGRDVFNKGTITAPTAAKFSKLMQTFRLFIELYEVDGQFAVATSAMREAGNGRELRDAVLGTTGVNIQIISGDEEARILNKAIIPFLNEGPAVHVDVGGGSTEINIYDGAKVVAGKSFRIGSVRKLSTDERTHAFAEMTDWIKTHRRQMKGSAVGIGTGGNINRLFKLSNRTGKTSMSLVELRAIRAYVKTFTVKQRMSILKLNPDRADVIVPASEIYIRVLEAAGADTILVPRVGLKDGIVYELYERTSKRDIHELEYLSTF
ncbi:exopolyphosphatase/guanosine-5'-triphosphate,3'-diphosphate pyrophosphatase [Lewinella aquimaris]|uniref:Exopolyphosphatase/guanosine-5'-triphosphate, 3'-diphosphate pyrophosphatase n=1 Tax=Neolewinella aquimaris TaxID=1835722 RepID=A0A840EFH7_9BACT|nr:phosphatase [Neolewinella aquimaris]MBB4080559.1 exopolyphosphatase/guanosine-5'-triphosphate,3'-diphosphate pyrophosphatase [Neolewinella aquimaris]